MTAIFWWLTTPSAASVLCMCGWMSSLRGSLRAITTWMAGRTTPEIRPAKSVTHSDQELSHFLRMLMLRWTVSASSASGDRTQMGIAAGSVQSQTADSAREVRRTARIAAISSFTSE